MSDRPPAVMTNVVKAVTNVTLDIVAFKAYNDTFDHRAGDTVLEKIAASL